MTCEDLLPTVEAMKDMRSVYGLGFGEAKRAILKNNLCVALVEAERLPNAERLDVYGAVLKHLVEQL